MSFRPGDKVRFHRTGNRFDGTEGIVIKMDGVYVNMTDTEGRQWAGTHYKEFVLVGPAPLDLSGPAQEYEDAMAGADLLFGS